MYLAQEKVSDLDREKITQQISQLGGGRAVCLCVREPARLRSLAFARGLTVACPQCARLGIFVDAARVVHALAPCSKNRLVGVAWFWPDVGVQATWENIWEWCRNRKKSQNRQNQPDLPKLGEGEGTDVQQQQLLQQQLVPTTLPSLMIASVQQEQQQQQQQQIVAAMLQAMVQLQAWHTSASATGGSGLGPGGGAAPLSAGTGDDEAAARALPSALTALFAPASDTASKAGTG